MNNESLQNKEQSVRGTDQIRHLLYFLELVNQALEVKLESVFLVPAFLHAAVNEVKSRTALSQLTQLGENILRHVGVLRQVIVDLGGAVEHDMLPQFRPDAQALLSTLSFQEELAAQIIEQCQDVVGHHWQPSKLAHGVVQKLELVLQETKSHNELLAKVFAQTQPRYKDSVLERFRVTALP